MFTIISGFTVPSSVPMKLASHGQKPDIQLYIPLVFTHCSINTGNVKNNWLYMVQNPTMISRNTTS